MFLFFLACKNTESQSWAFRASIYQGRQITKSFVHYQQQQQQPTNNYPEVQVLAKELNGKVGNNKTQRDKWGSIFPNQAEEEEHTHTSGGGVTNDESFCFLKVFFFLLDEGKKEIISQRDDTNG